MTITIDWNIADAKSHFSDLIKKSEQVPQVISRHGRQVSVVLSYNSYIALKHYASDRESAARIGEFLRFSRQLAEEDGGVDLELPPRSNRAVPDLGVDG